MARKGKMELLVGCTLNEAEVLAIKEGYEVRLRMSSRAIISQLSFMGFSAAASYGHA